MTDSSILDSNSKEYLLACLAEQLKIPLLQVSNIAENLHTSDLDGSRQNILKINNAAHRLINGFMLSLELSENSKLNLEPVSISSILYDTADSLQEYARLYNCSLELNIYSRTGPVMARADVLRSALENIVISFVSATSENKETIVLSIKRIGDLVTAGVFGNRLNINKSMLEKGRSLYGRSYQPLSDLSADSSVGIFVADSLISSMGSSMKVASMGKLGGLSASFFPSKQLSLV